MKRLILYSLLNSEKLENNLYEYEKRGYILYQVKWRYVFYFRKRITNTIGKYLSLYLLPRDTMAFELDNKITHSRANEIQTYFSNIIFYRYSVKDNNIYDDISDIISFRKKYIKHVYLIWMIVNAAISFPLLFCFVVSLNRQVIVIRTIMFGILFGCFFAFFIIFTIRFFKSRHL